MIEWITFEPNENSSLLKEAKALQLQACKNNDFLSQNYLPKNYNLDEQIAITLGLFQNKWISFTSLYHRSFFGNNVARTMNRYWKLPEFRINSNIIQENNIHSLSIIPQHIKIAKKYNFNSLFISREFNSFRWFKKLSKILTEKTEIKWIAHPNKVLICNNPRISSCWHNILYCSLDQKTFPNGVLNDRV